MMYFGVFLYELLIKLLIILIKLVVYSIYTHNYRLLL